MLLAGANWYGWDRGLYLVDGGGLPAETGAGDGLVLHDGVTSKWVAAAASEVSGTGDGA